MENNPAGLLWCGGNVPPKQKSYAAFEKFLKKTADTVDTAEKTGIFSEKVEINGLHILRYWIILKQNDMLF